jgi:hypothetical protein
MHPIPFHADVHPDKKRRQFSKLAGKITGQIHPRILQLHGILTCVPCRRDYNVFLIDSSPQTFFPIDILERLWLWLVVNHLTMSYLRLTAAFRDSRLKIQSLRGVRYEEDVSTKQD